MNYMLSALLALSAFIGLLPVASRYIGHAHTMVQAHEAAEQAKQIENAADAYIRANYQAIVTATASGPQQVSIATLASNGYLPPGISAVNAYGQSWSLSLYQPSTGDVEALLTTSGGAGIEAKVLPNVAAQIGSKGGFQPYSSGLYQSKAGDAVGSYGGWQVPVSPFGLSPSPGHLAMLMYYRNGQQASDYLYRVKVPGQPQLNTMQTALDMGNNDINNAKDVNVNQNVVAGTPGSCTTDADGHCEGQISAAGTSETDLPANWKGGITTHDMHADGTIAAGPSGQIQADMNDNATGAQGSGGMLHVQSPNGSQSTDITATNGGANIQTTGRLGVMGLPAWTGYPSGWGGGIHTYDLYAQGTVGAGPSGGPVKSFINSSGWAYLQPGIAHANWGCYPDGAIGTDPAGGVLSCVYGRWQGAAGVSFYVPPTSDGEWGRVRYDWYTGGFSCPPGTGDHDILTIWYGNWGFTDLHACIPY